MSESRTSRFLRFLSRIRSTRPLAEEDAESVSHLAINNNEERIEEAIHYANQKEEIEPFLKHGFRTYRSAELGLAALGWKGIPAGCGPVIIKGAFASVRLAYKLSDRGLLSRVCRIRDLKPVRNRQQPDIQTHGSTLTPDWLGTPPGPDAHDRQQLVCCAGIQKNDRVAHGRDPDTVVAAASHPLRLVVPCAQDQPRCPCLISHCPVLYCDLLLH